MIMNQDVNSDKACW